MKTFCLENVFSYNRAMAMRTRKHRQRQEPLWYRAELAEAPGHPFYRRLKQLLEEADLDR